MSIEDGYIACLCPEDGLVPGLPCDYETEFDDGFCGADGVSIVYCGDDNMAYEASCAPQCPGGDGTCGMSTELGYNACLCPAETIMLPGEECDFWRDRELTYCQYDGSIVYCAEEDNYVYEADCASQCPLGDGTCGFSEELGTNACLCPDAFVVGADCDPTIHDDSYNTCMTSNQLAYCDWLSATVVGLDCAAFCGESGATGYCDYDWEAGSNQCICEGYIWAPGYGCNYVFDATLSTCDGTMVTYCGDDNIIYARDCWDYCVNDLDATTGTCGVLPDVSPAQNGCVCEWTACDFLPYCDNVFTMVYCDPTLGATYLDCAAQCVLDGFTTGVCDYGIGQCACY
jgi:hypothetical protein